MAWLGFQWYLLTNSIILLPVGEVTLLVACLGFQQYLLTSSIILLPVGEVTLLVAWLGFQRYLLTSSIILLPVGRGNTTCGLTRVPAIPAGQFYHLVTCGKGNTTPCGLQWYLLTSSVVLLPVGQVQEAWFLLSVTHVLPATTQGLAMEHML